MKNLPLILAYVSILLWSCKKNETSSNEDPLKSGMIAFYPFNGNAQDESGNNYHLTVHDAVLATDRFGKSAKAYSFDGTKAFLKIPRFSEADSLRALTISVWVKTETPRDVNGILSLIQKNDYISCSSILGLHNVAGKYNVEHKMLYSQKGGTCAAAIVRDNISNPLNNWIHLVVVQRYKPGAMPFPENEYSHYLNGAKLKGGVGENPTSTSFSWGGAIGCNNNSGDDNFNFDFTKGVIDDIRIYNKALSDDEVLRLYNLDF